MSRGMLEGRQHPTSSAFTFALDLLNQLFRGVALEIPHDVSKTKILPSTANHMEMVRHQGPCIDLHLSIFSRIIQCINNDLRKARASENIDPINHRKRNKVDPMMLINAKRATLHRSKASAP